jgi:hypothetical protein
VSCFFCGVPLVGSVEPGRPRTYCVGCVSRGYADINARLVRFVLLHQEGSPSDAQLAALAGLFSWADAVMSLPSNSVRGTRSDLKHGGDE